MLFVRADLNKSMYCFPRHLLLSPLSTSLPCCCFVVGTLHENVYRGFQEIISFIRKYVFSIYSCDSIKPIFCEH